MRRAGLATTANEQYGEQAAGMRRRRRRKATLVRSKLPPYCPDARQACGTKNGEQRRSVTADCRICRGDARQEESLCVQTPGEGTGTTGLSAGVSECCGGRITLVCGRGRAGRRQQGDGAAECARCVAAWMCRRVYVEVRRAMGVLQRTCMSVIAHDKAGHSREGRGAFGRRRQVVRRALRLGGRYQASARRSWLCVCSARAQYRVSPRRQPCPAIAASIGSDQGAQGCGHHWYSWRRLASSSPLLSALVAVLACTPPAQQCCSNICPKAIPFPRARSRASGRHYSLLVRHTLPVRSNGFMRHIVIISPTSERPAKGKVRATHSYSRSLGVCRMHGRLRPLAATRPNSSTLFLQI